jgi:hypothetical protein
MYDLDFYQVSNIFIEMLPAHNQPTFRGQVPASKCSTAYLHDKVKVEKEVEIPTFFD